MPLCTYVVTSRYPTPVRWRRRSAIASLFCPLTLTARKSATYDVTTPSLTLRASARVGVLDNDVVADTPVDRSLGAEAHEVLGGTPHADEALTPPKRKSVTVDAVHRFRERAEMLRSNTAPADEARSLADEIRS